MSYPPYASRGKEGGREEGGVGDGVRPQNSTTRRDTRLEALLTHSFPSNAPASKLSYMRDVHSRPNPAYTGFELLLASPPSLPPSPRLQYTYPESPRIIYLNRTFLRCAMASPVCVARVFDVCQSCTCMRCCCLLLLLLMMML